MIYLKLYHSTNNHERNNLYIWYHSESVIIGEIQLPNLNPLGNSHGVRLVDVNRNQRADGAIRKIYLRFPSIFGLIMYD